MDGAASTVSRRDPSADLAVALELADVADRIARSRFGANDLVVDVKPNGSPVCDADRAIEAAVIERLRERYPRLPIFGEEHGPPFDGSAIYWTIDPIDGTAAFIAGEPGWSFTACLVEDGQPTVGVASSVGLGKRWWASEGQGAFVQHLPGGAPTSLRVSDQDAVSAAAIGWWDGYRTNAPGRTSRLQPVVAALEAAAPSIVAHGAAAVMVATGELDAALMRAPDNGPWHSALFVLLVREAGGMATNCFGDDTVLFSNPNLHSDLLDLIPPTLGPTDNRRDRTCIRVKA